MTRVIPWDEPRCFERPWVVPFALFFWVEKINWRGLRDVSSGRIVMICSAMYFHGCHKYAKTEFTFVPKSESNSVLKFWLRKKV